MKYLLSFFLLFFVQYSIAQSTAQITFEKEIHDFSEIPEGPKYATIFKFKNTGKEPLIISDAKGSCGCTVPVWPKEPIMPGATGEIKVEYNSAKRPGIFTKTVTITSNAAEATKVLKIKGNVIVEPEEETSPVKAPLIMAPTK